MHQIMYISQMSKRLSSEELQHIQETCHTNNVRAHISGLLLAWNNCFLQMLEGEKSTVLATYQRICNDPRHRDLRYLADNPVPTRRFSAWSNHLINFDVRSPHLKKIVQRHPPLSLTSDYYRDPMRAFALLYDMNFFMKNPP